MCQQILKTSDLRLQCIKCSNKFHKKCSEFKSKSGQWNEPANWICQLCISLNPAAITFHQSTVDKQPATKNKHKKTNLNVDSPDVEFLNATINTLKGTVAKNEIELKKLKESNDLKVKRILQLEAQVEESKRIITSHKCAVPKSNDDDSRNFLKESPEIADKCQQRMVSTLEARTVNLEQNMAILSAKFESFTLIKQNSHKIPSFICDICDGEFYDKSILKSHKTSCNEPINATEEHSEADQYEEYSNFDESPVAYFCDVCLFSTQYKITLEDHKRSSHQNTRYFFSSKRRVQKHKPSSSQSNANFNPPKREYPTLPHTTVISSSSSSSLQCETNGKFKCKKCDATFSHEDEHNLHIEYYHANIRQNWQ